MENIFYLELAKMAQEALDELDRYESTINYSGGAAVFDKIRAISVPCLDGEKISQSVKDDLPIRDQLEFQRAIFSMANLSSLSGGIGKNQNIKSKISYVLNKATTLSSRSQKNKNAEDILFVAGHIAQQDQPRIDKRLPR